MPGWNFAEIWEVVAEQVPDAPAQVQGDRRDHVGRVRPPGRRRGPGTLLDAGAERAGQGRPVPLQRPRVPRVDVRRLQGRAGAGQHQLPLPDDELVYLWDNADAVAVVFHGTFTERIERIRDRVPRVRLWLWVDDGAGPCPDWATPYEDAAAAGDRAAVRGAVGPRRRRPLHALHRRHHRHAQGRHVAPGRPLPQPRRHASTRPSATRARSTTIVRDHGRAARASIGLPACPLMHGTGCFTQLIVLCRRRLASSPSRAATSTSTSCSTPSSARGVNTIAIVGDAFAKPMLRALDAAPGRWDISSLS